MAAFSLWSRNVASAFPHFAIAKASRPIVFPAYTNLIKRYPILCGERKFRFGEGKTSIREKDLLMVSIDDDEQSTKTLTSTWDILGLKTEVSRLIFRCHKKISKASARLRNSQRRQEQSEQRLGQDVRGQGSDVCPDSEALEYELVQLQDRLSRLNALEQGLKGIQNKQVQLGEELSALALDLGVNDTPPKRNPRGPKKKKGPKQEAKRLPYRRYFAVDKTEIRVGKQAADNDELSLSTKHRNGSDWWMHASGCAGSHVVIRSGDSSLGTETVMDAAALAARQSKCHGSIIKVSMTRCRNVSKPPGAKPGLVRLSGEIKTVAVKTNEAETRLERLDKTVLIN